MSQKTWLISVQYKLLLYYTVINEGQIDAQFRQQQKQNTETDQMRRQVAGFNFPVSTQT
jgi:hypothetical protein